MLTTIMVFVSDLRVKILKSPHILRTYNTNDFMHVNILGRRLTLDNFIVSNVQIKRLTGKLYIALFY